MSKETLKELLMYAGGFAVIYVVGMALAIIVRAIMVVLGTA